MLISDRKIPIEKSTEAQNKEQKVKGANILIYATHAVLIAPSLILLFDAQKILFAPQKSQNFEFMFIESRVKFKHCGWMLFPPLVICNVSSPLTLSSMCTYIR